MNKQEIVDLIKEEIENNLTLELTEDCKTYFGITLKYQGESISWLTVDK